MGGEEIGAGVVLLFRVAGMYAEKIFDVNLIVGYLMMLLQYMFEVRMDVCVCVCLTHNTKVEMTRGTVRYIGSWDRKR